jgi:hypothetical protein
MLAAEGDLAEEPTIEGGIMYRPRKYRMKTGTRAIGWREWLAIPEWGVARIKAKIDSGARTSSVHVSNLHYFRRDGVEMVRFKVHPHQRSVRNTVQVEAPIVEKRVVRSSNGEEDLRPVVLTHVEIHGVCWPIEVTLAKRKLMGFRMLLGREAMWGRFIVDPSRSYLGGEPCMQLEDGEIFIQPRPRVKKDRKSDAGSPALELSGHSVDTDNKGKAQAK